MSELQTFRDLIWRRSPPWLRRGNNQRILYTLGLHLDVLGDALVAGVKSRFPGLYSFESLAWIGRDRRIARGRSEASENYAERLTRWLVDHQHRGNPLTMLAQLAIYYAPATFEIELLYANGVRFVVDLAGNITRSLVTWSPDGDAARWARWWLFIQTNEYAAAPLTPAQLSDVRAVPREWNAAHALGTIVLVPDGGELWNWPTDHVWNESGTWNTASGVRFVDVDGV